LPTHLQGDLITRVLAEDGDKQSKRLIRYGLLADSNPFVAFFDLDPMSGMSQNTFISCQRKSVAMTSFSMKSFFRIKL